MFHKEYTFYVLNKGKRPTSVRAFMDSISLTEKEFYQYYPNFEELEKEIFVGYFQEVADKLQKDSTFAAYNSAEKVLAMYYAWFENLRLHRSFISFLEKQKPFWVKFVDFVPLGGRIFKFLIKQTIAAAPPYVLHLHNTFKTFAKPIIEESMGEEIAERFWISSKYDELIWGQAVILYRYWLNDKSPNFEKTDIAIEKSTIFVFDLLRPNSWDTGFDLVKFMVQRK